MKIIVARRKNDFSEEQISQLEKLGAIFTAEEGITLESMRSMVNENDEVILAIHPGVMEDSWESLPLDELTKFKNLKGVCLATTSYSWIDYKSLRELNIPVVNTPGKSTNAVAEFNIQAMLMLLRKYALLIKENWKMKDIKEMQGIEAKNLVAGIVGLGQIGSRTAELCAGMGMKVKYWNRTPKETSYERVEKLEDLMKQTDVLFVTIAANPELDNLLNKDMLSLLRPTSYVVTITHDNVFDSKYLIEAVGEGKLAGFAYEGNEQDMFKYKGNVLITPEIGYLTKQTVENESRIFTEGIMALANGKPINVIN